MVRKSAGSVSCIILPLANWFIKLKRVDLYNKSRVMGDYQARFCERLRVKLPLPTRPPTVTLHPKKSKITKQIKMIKPGKNDIKVFIKFEPEELDLLQENTWQMAESFGLDSRIAKLSGKRKVGFYSWDLECLECVVGDLKNSPHAETLYAKIKEGMDFIDNQRNK
jgi:hypothetical protein